MKHFVRLVIYAYSRALDLYPRRFRDEFAVEMHSVFSDRIKEAVEEGLRSFIIVCCREFMGMPFNILTEFWHEFQGQEAVMPDAPFIPLKKGTWGESFWAGLPHLLFATFVAISRGVTTTRLAAISGIILVLLLFAGLLVTIYYTWRNHWPIWSASWYGYVSIIVLLFAVVPSQYWAGIGDEIFKGIRFILLLLSLATLLYWLSRRNPIEGLLMAMPVIILYWFPVMEFVPISIRFWLTCWIFLLCALTAITITRLNDIQRAVWLVLGASILIGLPIAYARTYWHNIPPEYSSLPTIGKLAELFSVPWLTSGALVVGPILGWGLWNLGRKYGKIGRASVLLVMAGMIVNLLGHFSYWWWFSKETYLNALPISALYQPGKGSSIFMVYAGLAAILIGAIRLAVLTWKKNKLLSIALILVPLALPLVARLTTYFGFYISLAGMSLELASLSEVYKSLIFFVGAVWLVMSGWTVTRLYQPLVDRETA